MTAGCWACADRAMHDGDVCDHCGAMADAHGVLWLPDAPERPRLAPVSVGAVAIIRGEARAVVEAVTVRRVRLSGIGWAHRTADGAVIRRKLGGEVVVVFAESAGADSAAG